MNAEEKYRKENLIVGTSAMEYCSFCKRSVERENHVVIGNLEKTKPQHSNLNQNEI